MPFKAKNLVCLDIRFRTLSGGSTVVTNLVPAMVKVNKAFDFIILQYEDQHIPGLESVKKLYAPRNHPLLEILWVQSFLPLLLKRHGCKLYVLIKHPVGPFFSKIAKVYNVRNIYAKFREDEFPMGWKEHIYWFVLGKACIIRSRRLIAVSQFIKTHIVESLGYPADRIDAIPNGLDPDFRPMSQTDRIEARARLSLPRRFILACGNVVPVKNHETVIRALSLVRRTAPDIHLVIAGRTNTSHYDHLRREIHRLGLDEWVHFKGFVSKQDLTALYNCAEMLVFPSLTESFGNAAAEAMACGLPVIASKRGAIPEICGSAALYVQDPRDDGAFAEIISRLLKGEERAHLVAEGLKRVKDFSWEKAAVASLESFGKALEFGG